MFQVVCGTDGQNYESECHLEMAACQKNQYIVVANQGNCGEINMNRENFSSLRVGFITANYSYHIKLMKPVIKIM